MGRALYSMTYAPVIREPSPSPYEKWSISNPFDPDSEEFFEGAQYEAFLPDPIPPTDSAQNDELPRMVISTTRITTTRDADSPTVPPAHPNPMILDSVPHDSPEADSPSSPPRSLNEDTEPSRPTLSPMAGDSDAEDPIRILADFVSEYRNMRRNGGPRPNLLLSEILRQVDGELRREQRQQTTERPQRYLPPLDYSSDSASLSSRSESPTSPIFFPAPPSPPPMSREANAISLITDSLPEPQFPLDEDLERIEQDLRVLDEPEEDESLSAPSEVTESAPTSTINPIPISIPRTSARAPLYVHRGTPGSFGYDIGLDMSPPPSVSPRLYNWSRAGSESHPRFSSGSFTRRSYIPVTEGRRI
ncbi:hypothetical protein GYMLUDRAFT_816507 [Collybiopsis luxurians FD-317 M1]|uniref:Uncharacterized protein n=1 Tax=Collybiopsis luxurians FD-317 M1 TaxID=944289 RepID=A0A0D0C1Y7_9AGAR|nr:hypothetical protein GYMLUDRAFT_816507 [Collybiopsis luxurians FD-317 M1]